MLNQALTNTVMLMPVPLIQTVPLPHATKVLVQLAMLMLLLTLMHTVMV